MGRVARTAKGDRVVKSKRKARCFINYLYRNYDVPRIPIYIHWHYRELINEAGKTSYGLFVYDDSPLIHVAGGKAKTTGVLSIIAHEFVHYLQYLHGRDMDDSEQIEKDAEHYGKGLFGLWLLGEKDCSWLKAWEPKEDA